MQERKIGLKHPQNKISYAWGCFIYLSPIVEGEEQPATIKPQIYYDKDHTRKMCRHTSLVSI